MRRRQCLWRRGVALRRGKRGGKKGAAGREMSRRRRIVEKNKARKAFRALPYQPNQPMLSFLIFFIRRLRAAAFFFLRMTLGFS